MRCPRAEPRGRRGNPPFYEVFGKRYYVMASSEGFVERGTASWYGPGFHAASTSLGEPYDMYAMTAAHKTLPIPAYAEVTNLQERPQGRRAHQRPRTVRRRPHHRPVLHRGGQARHAAGGHRAGGGARHHARRARRRLRAAAGRRAAAPRCRPQPPVTVVNAPAAKTPGVPAMFIQAGVFADHENARRRVEVLLAAGIELASLDEIPRSERALHRVRVGPFASVEEFDLTMRRLRELGITDARLLTD